MLKTINREEFLRVLEGVRPGTTPKDISEQSSCVVFKNGKAYTFNEDVYCRIESGLPQDWTAAIPFPPLVAILSKLGETELDLDLTDSELTIKGKGRKTELRAEKSISMPYDQVTLPGKSDWKKLSGMFSEAIALIEDCAGTNADEFAMTCVHVHPKWVEASDRTSQMGRHRIKTGLEEPVLLRKESLSPVAALVPKKIAVTDNWVHFKTASGSYCAVRKNEGGYFDLDKAFEVKGTKVTLPKGLKEASDKAEIFTAEDKDNNYVMISLSPNKVRLIGRSESGSGKHTEWKKTKYAGPPMSFMISPRLLREILDRSTDCFVQKDRLVVTSGKWVYVSILVQSEETDNGTS